MKLSVMSIAMIGAIGLGFRAVPTSGDDISAEQYSVILNLSGRQRMLTQKMSKEFLLVAADVSGSKNRENLKGTMGLFEKTLKGLRDGDAAVGLPPTPNARVVRQLDKIRKLYEIIQPALIGTADGARPEAAELATVAGNNLPVLSNMNKAVKMYERESRKVLEGADSLGVVINLAGKQRMLTQKMSKEFMLVYLGINTDENRLNLRETTALFDQTLAGLIDGNEDFGLPGTKDVAIRKQLKAVDELWKKFQPVVRRACDEKLKLTKGEAQQVATMNMPLLREMNAAVKMYELQGKDIDVQPASE
ncbi:MAG: hypothetical protein GY930_15320 [bacterium]|nr:hypothetical protein [bacterium]